MIVEATEEYKGYTLRVSSESTLGSTLIDYKFEAEKDLESVLVENIEQEKERNIPALFEEFKLSVDALTETNTNEESVPTSSEVESEDEGTNEGEIDTEEF